MCAMPLEREIEYPTSDGQPMAETTLHREVMSDMIGGLERHYAEVPDMWVGGNLFVYYRKGDPAACVAPDVLLIKGVRKWKRPSYLLWEEKEPPALVFEITSQSTRREDQDKKKKTYQMLGVEEMILFDPYGEYLKPRLQGYRLGGQGTYQPIPLNAERIARQPADRSADPARGGAPAAGRPVHGRAAPLERRAPSSHRDGGGRPPGG